MLFFVCLWAYREPRRAAFTGSQVWCLFLYMTEALALPAGRPPGTAFLPGVAGAVFTRQPHCVVGVFRMLHHDRLSDPLLCLQYWGTLRMDSNKNQTLKNIPVYPSSLQTSVFPPMSLASNQFIRHASVSIIQYFTLVFFLSQYFSSLGISVLYTLNHFYIFFTLFSPFLLNFLFISILTSF